MTTFQHKIKQYPSELEVNIPRNKLYPSSPQPLQDLGVNNTILGNMITQIENYIIDPCKDGVKITLDQRHEAQKGLKFVWVMIVVGLIACPWGPFSNGLFTPLIFTGWIAGWSISGFFAWYITDWRQEFFVSRHRIAITEIRKGKHGSPKIIRIKDTLKVKVRHNRGVSTGRGSGLGRHYSPPVFQYTIIAEGEGGKKTDISLNNKSNVDHLLSILTKTVPLEVEYL